MRGTRWWEGRGGVLVVVILSVSRLGWGITLATGLQLARLQAHLSVFSHAQACDSPEAQVVLTAVSAHGKGHPLLQA